MKKFLNITILVLFLLSLNGCRIKYTLSGATVGDAKTFSVAFFRNVAQLVYPPLSQDFTEKLRDKFMGDTGLTMVSEDGDLHFEGEITQYETQPLAVTAAEEAATFRLTVSIQVKYTNSDTQEFEFDKAFTATRDYTDPNFSSVEAELVEEIIEEIVNNVFRESVVNW